MDLIIHIGFSKCASTYIQSIFKNNNSINYVYKSKKYSILDEEIKQHYLSDRLINIESDEHIILPSVHPILKIRGTRIEDVKKVIEKIMLISPNAKLILVIRNQMDLLKSRYSQYIVGGGGKLKFESFLNEIIGIETDEDYYQNYYYQIITMIQSIFGSERLLVLLFEDIYEKRDGIVKEISEFVGIDFIDLKPNIVTMRKGLSRKGLNKIRLLNKLVVIEKQDIYDNIKLKIPFFLYVAIKRIIRIYDYLFGNGKIEITNDCSEMIMNKFALDNENLAKLLNRDLKKNGYLL